MLLTNQQKFLLDAVNRLGCVREDQLVDLIRPVFCQKRPDIAPALVHSAIAMWMFGGKEMSFCTPARS